MAKEEKFHVNSVDIEGLITKVWDRGSDVFARLAVYDEQAEELEPGKGGGLPKRQAHYVTLQFLDGKTADGIPVSLGDKDHVRVTGYLRDAAYSEAVSTFLRKAKQFDRIRERDQEIRVGRVATYVVAKSMVRFSK